MKEYKPRTELTQLEALQSITRRELRTVKEAFGVSLINDFDTKLDECIWALVWVFEKRANPDFKIDSLDDFEIGEVMNYFTDDNATLDGESEAGKA